MNTSADHPPANLTGPEPLSLRFANTHYAVRGQTRDGIGTPELLRDWLAGELGPDGAIPPVDQADVDGFVELRDAVRELITVAVHGPAPDGGRTPACDEALALLNRLSQDAPTWPALMRAGGRFEVVDRRTTPDARAVLAQDAITLLGGDLSGALRACGAPGCVLFFVKDHPRREWCSPGCGNRVRAARHYQRRRDAR